jgi:YesN/AraC family two-component response regulator
VFEQCEYGSFSGTCHAGVFEYVYPIKTSQKLIGFISVSGYQSDLKEDKLYLLSTTHNLSLEYLNEIYQTLDETAPSKDFIDTLISPLQRMLELAYEKKISKDLPSDFFQNVVGFIRMHYTESLTSDIICKHFSCSRSYLSHQFKNKCGLSLREYITILRIEDAKSLLLHSNLNVTEIAIAVGFSDSNYFSKAFKKATGLSPINYKKGR